MATTRKTITEADLMGLPPDPNTECGIPEHVLESIARMVLPDIIAFFETEEGQKEFEAWRQEQELLKQQDEEQTDCGPLIGQMQILNESIKQAGSVKTPCLIQLYGNSSDLGKIAENEKSETVTDEEDLGLDLTW